MRVFLDKREDDNEFAITQLFAIHLSLPPEEKKAQTASR
jgi:hypothetical protein